MRITVALLILLSTPSVTEPAPRAVAQTGTNIMADSVMPADRFWQVIDRTTKYGGDQDAQMEALRMELRKLPAVEIEAFERAFQEQQRRAYSWDLWGAAYIMCGGASDDGFEYFQRWLISRGRKTFDAAVADPDSLATTIPGNSPDEYDFELFAYVAGDVWKEKTGLDADRFPYTGMPSAPQPSGKPFEEDSDHLAKRYPKLWAKFGAQ